MMRFNERKATQAAAYLLNLRGGRMSYLKLIKLLYWADRAALARWGRPITTDRHVSMDRGPVLSHVLDLVNDGDVPDEGLIWGAAVSAPDNYEVQLKADPGDDELSEAEVGVLEEVWAAIRPHEPLGALLNWRTGCPNGKNPVGQRDPQRSYRDILAAQGIGDEEIEAIEEEICGVAATQDLVGAR